MSITMFLITYFVGGILAWLAWSVIFIMARKNGFLDSPVTFFVDFTLGSIAPLVGWPFIIIFYFYSTLINLIK